MEHYFNTLKMPQPTMAFTPDSSFPVTFAETERGGNGPADAGLPVPDGHRHLAAE